MGEGGRVSRGPCNVTSSWTVTILAGGRVQASPERLSSTLVGRERGNGMNSSCSESQRPGAEKWVQ